VDPLIELERLKPAMSAIEQPLTTSIPGPIEFSDPVLAANATPGTSHVSPAFIPVFGDSLRMLRKVLFAEKEGSQPFLIAGSGTLGWDQAAANLVEAGEEAVVLKTGYFGDSFEEWCVLEGPSDFALTAVSRAMELRRPPYWRRSVVCRREQSPWSM
jgi:aspartate aminotransferase-like enzyme